MTTGGNIQKSKASRVSSNKCHSIENHWRKFCSEHLTNIGNRANILLVMQGAALNPLPQRKD